MRKIIIAISLIFLVITNLYATEDNPRNKISVVKILHNFHGWTHCSNRATPSWRSSSVTINDKSITINGNEKVTRNIIEYKTSNDFDNITFIANKYGYLYDANNHNIIANVTTVANNMDHETYETEQSLKVGENIFKEHEQTARCWLLKKEGYTVSTNIIVDIPVDVTIEEASGQAIKMDEGGRVHLQFGNFYDVGERYIQYSIDKGASWKRIYNSNIKVTPNGMVSLSHEDIFGHFSVRDKEFLKTVGVQIIFSVKKKMLDNDYSIGELSKSVAFYPNGPEFKLITSHLTACGGMQVSVDIDDVYTNLDNYMWSVTGPYDTNELSANNEGNNDTQDALHFDSFDGKTIVFEEKDRLSDPLFLERIKGKYYLVELQVKAGDDVVGGLFNCQEWFQIGTRPKQISGAQPENTKKTAIPNDPKVCLKIDDDLDVCPNGRFPYTIWEYDNEGKNGRKSCTIKSFKDYNDYNETELKKEFKAENNYYDLDKTKDTFIKESFFKWYDNNTGTTATTTIKYSGDRPTMYKEYDGSWVPDPYTKGTGTDGMVIARVMDGYTYVFGIVKEANANSDNVYYKSVKFNSEIRDIAFKETGQYKGNTYSISGGGELLRDGSIVSTTNLGTYEYKGKGNACILAKPVNSSSNAYYLLTMQGLTFEIYQIGYIYDNVSDAFVNGNKLIALSNNRVYYNGYTYSTYTNINKYSVNQIDDNGFFYYSSDNKTEYYQKASGYTKEELYNYFKKGEAVIPYSYFNDSWNTYVRERSRLWTSFLAKKLYYQVPVQSYKSSNNNGKVYYNGKIKIVDSDGCESNLIDYTLEFYDLDFDEAITYPSSLTSEDGKAVLTFKNGSFQPYTYKSESGDIKIGNNYSKTITFEGLGFHKYTKEFIGSNGKESCYSFELSVPSVNISVNDILCEGGSGSVSVTSTNYTFNSYKLKNSDNEYTSTNGTFGSVAAGNYVLYGIMSNNNSIELEDDVSVDNKALKAEVIETVRAAKIGENGYVNIKIHNATGTITFSATNENGVQINIPKIELYNKSEQIYSIYLPKGKYVITANNSGTCSYTIENIINIDGPSISLDPAGTTNTNGYKVAVTMKTRYDKDNKSTNNVEVKAGKIEGIKSYKYLLKDNSNKEYALDGVSDISKTYSLIIRYTNFSDETYDYPLVDGLYFAGIEKQVLIISNPFCSGNDGTVSTTVASAQRISLSGEYDENAYKEIKNNTFNESVPIGTHSIWFRNEQTESWGKVISIREQEVTIEDAPRYSCSVVTETDHVTCNGGADGVIAISDEINKDGKGTFTYTLYNASGTKTDKVLQNGKFSGLSAGAYKVVISSNECGVLMTVEDELSISNPTKLQVSSKVLADPTCREDDGAIKITDINGGSGKYRLMYSNKALQQSNNTLYNPSNNTEITDEIKYSKENILDYGEYGEECAECTEENAIPELLTKTIDKKEYEIKGLPHGNYYLLVYDSYGCVYQSEKINLKEYINPKVTSATSKQTSCYGYEDGKIVSIETQKDPKADNTFALYCDKNGKTYKTTIWDKDNTSITGLPAGSYDLWLVDNNNCQSDKPLNVDVSQPDPITLEAYRLKDVTAFGGNDGEVQLYAKGGNKCDKSIYVLKQEILEAEDEQKDAEQQPEAPESKPEEQSAPETTDNNEQQQPENTAVMAPESAPENLGDECAIGESALRENNYTITKYKFGKGEYIFQVRDVQNGCLSNVTAPIEILAPEAPISATTKVNRALCYNETGSVTVTPEGGWGKPYKVTLNRLAQKVDSASVNANTDKATFANLLSGTYTLEITDKLGGKYTTTVDVPMPNKAITFSNSTFVAERCEADGEAHIVIEGGSGTFTTNLLGQSYSEPQIDVTNMKSGFYTLHTIDANKCESMYNFEIPDERLSVELKQYHTPEQGTVIEAEVSNGTAPYTYEWNRVDAEEAVLRGGAEPVGNKITGIVQGIYSLKLTDFKGCERKAVTDMLTDGSRRMRVVELQRETHPDVADGYVVLASDTTINFVSKQLYHLQSESFTNIESDFADGKIRIDNLRGGDYVVKFALSDGRLRTAQFNIAPYEPMTIDTLALRHVSLPYRADGVLKFNVNGGIAPFTVSTTHTTDQSYVHKLLSADSRYFAVDSLIAGEYEVQVTDSTGNKTEIEFKVIEPEDLVLKCDSRTPASCYGYSDGEVSLSAHGGWGKYQFAEANGSYSRVSSFRGLSAGGMSFEVIDKYGTVAKLRVYIDQPDSLKFTLAQVDSVSCYKLNDGAISFDVTGGNGGYEMLYTNDEKYNPDKWSPYRNDTTALTHLTSGNYQVSFTDQNGCYAYDTMEVFVPQPDELVISDFQVTHTTCDTDNGRIQITTDGGSLPYRYSWVENGETDIASTNVDAHNNQIVNLKQDGLYQVGITDLHGCATEGSYRIDHSSKPKVSAVSTVDVTCFGLSDGIAAVDSAQVVYGYPWSPFTLTWPQGQNNTMSVNTLPTGEYYVRITDGNDCVDSTLFAVGTPEPVKLSLVGTRDAHCYGYEDGQIDVAAHGGVGEYVFVWDRGDTDSSIKNIGKGRYHVTVNDAHNCVDTASYSIDEPDELLVDLGNDALICPQGHHVFDAGEYNTYEWYKVGEPEVLDFGRYLAVGEEGDYRIVVTDRDGCFARDTVRLSIGENALVANFLMASDASLADTVMLIELSNMPLDSLKWETSTDFKEVRMPDIDTEDYLIYLKPNKTGTYNITMKAYSGGCESYETKEIEIFEAQDEFDNFDVNYNPLIKAVKATPNPNNGRFDLKISLRETHDCALRINSINTGQTIDNRTLDGNSEYVVTYDISNYGNGLYVLSVNAGTERRVLKLLVKSK